MPTLELDQYSLFYRLVGTPSNKPPVVMIHGLASNHKDWLLQLPPLCRERQILLIDLPGHGRSGCPPQTNVNAMAQDITALLSHLKIDRCVVVGLSMGGMVAMSLASSCPDRVEKLVLVNTAPSLKDLIFSVKALLPFRYLMTLIPMSILARILLHHLIPGPHKKSIRDYAFRSWRKNNHFTLNRILGTMIQTNLWEALPGIQAKTLVVHASNDSFTLMSAEKMVQRIPHASMKVIPHSGHGTVADQPAHFNDVLCRFLEAPTLQLSPGSYQPEPLESNKSKMMACLQSPSVGEIGER